MNIFSLVLHKLRSFRMSIPSLVLLVLASYRTLTSGHSIELVGICASVVPFICQFKNFPQRPDGVSERKDVIGNFLMNLILVAVYLAYILVLTFIGSRFIPGYILNPHFYPMLLLAICANVVFISVIIPVCHDLKPLQRAMPGILMCNGQLVFMMMAADYVEKVNPARLPSFALGFSGLVLILAFGFITICYSEKKKQ